MCKYIDDSQWNTGSIFVKPESIDIWQLIVEFMRINDGHPELLQTGDENIVNFIYHQYPEIQSRFSQLNNRYNVGCTQFGKRVASATAPIVVAAFKPSSTDIQKFQQQQLISIQLQDVFNKHIIGVY
jgi:hypothetical protein